MPLMVFEGFKTKGAYPLVLASGRDPWNHSAWAFGIFFYPRFSFLNPQSFIPNSSSIPRSLNFLVNVACHRIGIRKWPFGIENGFVLMTANVLQPLAPYAWVLEVQPFWKVMTAFMLHGWCSFDAEERTKLPPGRSLMSWLGWDGEVMLLSLKS